MILTTPPGHWLTGKVHVTDAGQASDVTISNSNSELRWTLFRFFFITPILKYWNECERKKNIEHNRFSLILNSNGPFIVRAAPVTSRVNFSVDVLQCTSIISRFSGRRHEICKVNVKGTKIY